MNAREEFAELPPLVKVFLMGLVVGGAVGMCVAAANLIRYYRAPEMLQGEVIELGALTAFLLGFPLSLGLAPFLMFLPWVWLVVLPAFNLGLLAIVGFSIYSGVRRLPLLRDFWRGSSRD